MYLGKSSKKKKSMENSILWWVGGSGPVKFHKKKNKKLCSKWPKNQFKSIKFFHLIGGGGGGVVPILTPTWTHPTVYLNFHPEALR